MRIAEAKAGAARAAKRILENKERTSQRAAQVLVVDSPSIRALWGTRAVKARHRALSKCLL